MAFGNCKILVAMSGGVDSSVAAALLRDAGYQVVGVFMRTGVEADRHDDATTRRPDDSVGHYAPAAAATRTCCSVADAADARRVAGALGIPFYVLNFADEFAGLIDYFIDEYSRGRTPNPCVMCNSRLKFGKLFDYAAAVGADAVATGHYARIVRTGDGCRLARGADPAKDQSYVLFDVSVDQLGRMVLPLGEWTKERVRAKAAELRLPVADKPDSQEVCFVPDDDYAGLIRRRRPGSVQPGRVLDQAGRVIGEHPGHQHFTIGQRRGLGIAAGAPIYVTAIDAEANTVTVGPAEALRRTELTCSRVNWHVRIVERGLQNAECFVQIRYNASATAATVTPLGDDRARVVFASPVSAVTPGQAAVFYDSDGVVIGGGWID